MGLDIHLSVLNEDIFDRKLKELKLSKINNLQVQLIKTNFDALNNSRYFSNFKENMGNGYIGNNFDQDIRNLLAEINIAKSIGEKTVYFRLG